MKLEVGIAHQKYTILDEENGWYQIQMEDGKTRWILGKLGIIINGTESIGMNTFGETRKSKYDYTLSGYSRSILCI